VTVSERTPTTPADPIAPIGPTSPFARGAPSSLDNLPILIPVPTAARLLGISRSAAYRCTASGELPSTHLGGRVYVVTSRLRELLESA
jgi:excisionase family DNA binding protein